MTIVEILNILLPNISLNELGVLIYIATEDAKTLTGLAILPESLNPTIAQMVLELHSKRNAEGLKSQSFDGVSETFIEGYSVQVLSILNKARAKKLKVI